MFCRFSVWQRAFWPRMQPFLCRTLHSFPKGVEYWECSRCALISLICRARCGWECRYKVDSTAECFWLRLSWEGPYEDDYRNNVQLGQHISPGLLTVCRCSMYLHHLHTCSTVLDRSNYMWGSESGTHFSSRLCAQFGSPPFLFILTNAS